MEDSSAWIHSKIREKASSESFSLWEKKVAAAPDEGGPPHDPCILQNHGAGCPHPALLRHPLPVGEGTTPLMLRVGRIQHLV